MSSFELPKTHSINVSIFCMNLILLKHLSHKLLNKLEEFCILTCGKGGLRNWSSENSAPWRCVGTKWPLRGIWWTWSGASS